MKQVFKTTLLLLAILLPTIALAYDFEVDGIYYNINGSEVEVTCADNNWNISDYSGNVTIPENVSFNGTIYSVTSIGENAFCGCSGLTTVTIPNSILSIGRCSFESCNNLISVSIPNSVTTIGDYAFYDCSSLIGVTIGNSVTSIGKLAFFGSSGLNSIVVESGNPKYDSRNNCNAIIETSSNTVFAGCKNTIIPNSVTSIGDWAFSGCSSLTSIIIPNSVTTIGWYAFDWCNSLTSITIPNSVTYIGNGAFEYSALTNIYIPNSVTYIGCYAFYNCSSLTSITIPNSVTYIESGTFEGCSALTSVTIPHSVTEIYDCAFSGCSGLVSVTIPNSVTSIRNSTFEGCSGLTTLFLTGEGEWQAGELPNTVTTLYIDTAITAVPGMKEKPVDVFCFAKIPPTCDNYSFSDYSGTLHIPATSLAAYFTASYWCNFVNIVGDAVFPTALSIMQDSVDALIGEEFQLNAEILPVNATANTIVWATSNPTVASVTNGKVAALVCGECDIIATCLDYRAVCHVIVYSDRITVDKNEVQVLPNHIVTVTPTSFADELPALIVSSNDPTIAAARVINNKIQIVGIKEGTTTITVGSNDGMSISATCLVTVYTEHGDLNSDGFVTIGDVTSLIDYLLTGNASAINLGNADFNQDNGVTISDVTALIDYLLTT